MNKISKDQCLSLWENNNSDIGVYIHSPFCKAHCKYCAYKCAIYNQDSYDKYYYEYLPSLLEFYHPVMENNVIHSWFFGGGTPSLMTIETLDSVISKLPEKFHNEGFKTFEAHPKYFSTEYIDALKRHNFNLIILGVQTFDKEEMLRQNREWVSPEDIKALTDYAHNLGIYVSIDLMGSMDEGVPRNLSEDLDELENIHPDAISVSTNYRLSREQAGRDWQIVMEHPFILSNMFPAQECFQVDARTSRFFHKESSLRSFPFLRFLEEGALLRGESGGSLLGIGELNNVYKKTYSHINQTTNLIEVNNNWTPEFYLVHQHDFFEKARNFLDLLEKEVGAPPIGSEIKLTNRVMIEKGTDASFQGASNILPYLPWRVDSPAGSFDPEAEEKLKTFYEKIGKLPIAD